MNKILTSILICPRTGQNLKESAEGLSNLDGSVHYPGLNSVPIVVENPQVFVGEWQIQVLQLRATLRSEISQLNEELKSNSLSSITKTRLKVLRKAKQKHLKNLLELFQPLLAVDGGGDNEVTDGELSQAFLSHGRQHLLRYEANLFRDWAWGDVENQIYIEILEKLLGSTKPETTLFIGAGAGRLPYDFHQRWKPTATMVIEINPLFVLTAHQLISGQTLELFEFPFAALPKAASGVSHTLRAPEKMTDPSFQWIFANGVQPPVRPGSVQTLITPWFIDIVESDFKTLAHRYNQILSAGGHWLNFGSCFFQGAPFSGQYSWQEVLEILEQAGFRIQAQSEQVIPYLNSPHSAHQRQETIFIFSAEKVAESELELDEIPIHPWLIDTQIAVPQMQEWSDSASIARFQFEVLSSINGQRSIDEIATAMSQRYGFTITQCKATLIQLLVEHLSISSS